MQPATRSLVRLAATAFALSAVARSARADDLVFQFDLRATGFYASGTVAPAPSPVTGVAMPGKQPSSGAGVLGFQLGGSYWLTKGFGLLFMTGADGGYLFAPHLGTLLVDWELGPEFLAGGNHHSGTIISITWAPKLLSNLKGGEVGSPAGFEVAFNIYGIKIPLWMLHALDGGNFLGAGLAFGY
jgi:hypothetical protein